MGEGGDQIGIIDNSRATFGRTYVGAPDKIAAELAKDEGIAAADTLLVTVPNQIGVDHNRHTFEVLVGDVTPPSAGARTAPSATRARGGARSRRGPRRTG